MDSFNPLAKTNATTIENHNLMKSFRLLFCLTCAAIGLMTPASAQLKIGTVDMNKVFNAMPKTDDAKAALKKAEEAAESELKERMDAYKTVLEAAKKAEKEVTSSALSESAKAEKRKVFAEKATEVRKLEGEINEFRQARLKQLQDQVLRNRKEIVDQIMVVVKAKYEGDGYDIVLDRSAPSATGVPTVLFSKDTIDFSDAVIAEIQKSSPKEDKK